MQTFANTKRLSYVGSVADPIIGYARPDQTGGVAVTLVPTIPPESRYLDEGVRVQLFKLDTTKVDKVNGTIFYFTPSLDSSGRAAAFSLDAWSDANDVNTLAKAVSAGLSRVLVVVAGAEVEDSTPTEGITATYGGRQLEKVGEVSCATGFSNTLAVFVAYDFDIQEAADTDIDIDWGTVAAPDRRHIAAGSYDSVEQGRGSVTVVETVTATTNSSTPNPQVTDLTEAQRNLVIAAAIDSREDVVAPSWGADMTETHAGGVGQNITVAERFSDTDANVDIECTFNTQIRAAQIAVEFRAGPGVETIAFKGNEYAAIPIEAVGFAFTAKGKMPQPTLRVGNAHLLLQGHVNLLGDLAGAEVTRLKTYEKYLDDRPSADPEMHYPEEVYRIDQKTAHNKQMIEWKLASVVDQRGTKLPRAQVQAVYCDHVYRRFDDGTMQFNYSEATCPYVGSAVFDAQGNVAASDALDVCGKQRRDCALRFPNDPLPTHAFFGAGRLRRVQ